MNDSINKKKLTCWLRLREFRNRSRRVLRWLRETKNGGMTFENGGKNLLVLDEYAQQAFSQLYQLKIVFQVVDKTNFLL